MKRFWAIFFGIIFVGGGFALWWFLRDTPEKALRDGIQGLIGLKTAKLFSLDAARSDMAARTTTGFSLLGQLDLKNPVRPRFLGTLRVGAASTQGQNQTGDLVIEDVALAVRPRSVGPELRATAEKLSGDPTGETFLVMGRDPFLEDNGFAKAISSAEAASLRQEAASILPSLVPLGKLAYGSEDGRPTIIVTFRIDGKSAKPVLLSLIKTWMGDNPTPDEYGWAEAMAADLATGSFELVLDKATRLPKRLSGKLSGLDDRGVEASRYSFTLGIEGYGQKVNIGIPEKAKDISSDVGQAGKQLKGSLPQGKLRSLPQTATGTDALKRTAVTTSTGKMIDETETDLFGKYYEEMLRKKHQQ